MQTRDPNPVAPGAPFIHKKKATVKVAFWGFFWGGIFIGQTLIDIFVVSIDHIVV